MGQIVKRTKKGRPPKADPASRELTPADSDLRRSLRPRNVKYVFDLDDYFDDDELFSDDVEHRQREKKLKHLLNGRQSESTVPRGERTRRVKYAPPDTSASSSDEEEKLPKKRKINDYMDYDDEDLDEENDDRYDFDYDDDGEDRESKPETNAEDSPPGTPLEAPYGLRLPDKKVLELILDKLKKKDIYGVYAEPVDADELPDYHDVIEHPMDFSTVRNKLREGSYSTLEQFESDVLLISSNAMQYNAPNTIYYKQALSIQELAKKKFRKIRLTAEHLEKEVYTEYPEQRTRTSSSLRKQIKRSVNRTVQESVGSDFSSGATLGTVGDFQNVTNVALQAGAEKLGSIDGGLPDGNSFFNNNNIDNVEEPVPGRGPLSRFSPKSYVLDDNRRATYTMSLSQPAASVESVFSTCEGETMQLVPVGLYSDHSYATSLARFAATLGSVAWKVASNRIEQAVPQGFKFGRGWVGDYEALPCPVLILENCKVKEPPFFRKVQHASKLGKSGKIPTVSVSSIGHAGGVHFLEKLPFLGSAETRPPLSAVASQPARSDISEMKPPFFLSSGMRPRASPNLSFQHRNSTSRSFVEVEKKVLKEVELNGPPLVSTNQANSTGNKQTSKSSQIEVSRPRELSSENIHLSNSGSFKHPKSKRDVFRESQGGKAIGNRVDGNTAASLSSDTVKSISYYPEGQSQGLTNSLQSMRMLAEKAQNQDIHSNTSVGTTQIMATAPSSANNNSNNAAAEAARTWMSVGAGGFQPLVGNSYLNKNQMHSNSLSNAPRDIQPQVSRFRGEFPPGMHVQLDKNTSQVHTFVPQFPRPMMLSNEIVFQNPQMVFPHQLANPDLSRFQLQSTWRNISPQMLSRQKPESLPPDLNIGFQSSSSSPGRPSTGVLVDSPQQPDLALQL